MADLNAHPAELQMQRCQSCGNLRAIAPITLRRNVGMLFARQTHTLKGNMCKTCINKQFWIFQGKNLAFGPWGMISLIATPIYFFTNLYAFAVARHKLRGAVE